MSYFHEYTRDQTKTLRTYSLPVDLRRFPTDMWVTSDEDCWEAGAALCDVKHFRLLTRAQESDCCRATRSSCAPTISCSTRTPTACARRKY